MSKQMSSGTFKIVTYKQFIYELYIYIYINFFSIFCESNKKKSKYFKLNRSACEFSFRFFIFTFTSNV